MRALSNGPLSSPAFFWAAANCSSAFLRRGGTSISARSNAALRRPKISAFATISSKAFSAASGEPLARAVACCTALLAS